MLPSTPEDFERARQFIAGQNWIFAKTMSDIPHWYCLKRECGDPEDFLWFARLLEANSVPGTFYGKEYHYLYLDGYRYWQMDSTPEECDLINRCVFPDPQTER